MVFLLYHWVPLAFFMFMLVFGGILFSNRLLARPGTKLHFLNHQMMPSAHNWFARITYLEFILQMSWKEWAMVILYVGAIYARLIYFLMKYYDDDVGQPVGRAISQVLGPLLCFAMLTPQRNTFMLWMTGMSVDRAVVYHKLAGKFFYTGLVAKLVSMAVSLEHRQGYSAMHIFDWANLTPDALYRDIRPVFGFVAFCCFSVTWFFSHSLCRRNCFELFYFTHLCYFFGNAAALIHNFYNVAPWLLPAVGLHVIDLCIRFYHKCCQTSRVVAIKPLSGGACQLELSRSDNFAYAPGQYIWLSLSGMHFGSSICSHPFSISSRYSKDKTTFHVTVKDMGPGSWSHKLNQLARQNANPSSLRVQVGGPNGRPIIEPTDYKVMVFCAGGSGASPLVSIFCHVFHEVQRKRMHVEKVMLIWVVRDKSHFGWFGRQLKNVLAGKNPAFEIRMFVSNSQGLPVMNDEGKRPSEVLVDEEARGFIANGADRGSPPIGAGSMHHRLDSVESQLSQASQAQGQAQGHAAPQNGHHRFESVESQLSQASQVSQPKQMPQQRQHHRLESVESQISHDSQVSHARHASIGVPVPEDPDEHHRVESVEMDVIDLNAPKKPYQGVPAAEPEPLEGDPEERMRRRKKHVVIDDDFFNQGRPPWRAILEELRIQNSRIKSYGVFACGPAGLVDDVEDVCFVESAGGYSFDFDNESFEL